MRTKTTATTATEAALLFRRKCPVKVPAGFEARLIGDACAKAAAEFARARLAGHTALKLFTVISGAEQLYDSKGESIAGKHPTYYWVRIQTVVISEDGRVPRYLRRNARGLLKPTYI